MEFRSNIIGSRKSKCTEQIYNTKDIAKTFHGTVVKEDNAWQHKLTYWI
jgi:hypothetical protein